MSLKRDTPSSLFRTHFRLACRTLLLSPLGAPPPPERTRSPFNKIEHRLLVCPQNMASNDERKSHGLARSRIRRCARATDTRRACLACIAEAPRATRALPLPQQQQQQKIAPHARIPEARSSRTVTVPWYSLRASRTSEGQRAPAQKPSPRALESSSSRLHLTPGSP